MQPYTIFSASSHFFLLKGWLFELMACKGSDAGTSANHRMEYSKTAPEYTLHNRNLPSFQKSFDITLRGHIFQRICFSRAYL
jgi:hypothetical protein